MLNLTRRAPETFTSFPAVALRYVRRVCGRGEGL
jgi:hypothetical protein